MQLVENGDVKRRIVLLTPCGEYKGANDVPRPSRKSPQNKEALKNLRVSSITGVALTGFLLP
jgi:hypothetical protein